MKQKITNAEKLYHLLFEVCTSENNKQKYNLGAYEMVLSVTLVMKNNDYKDIRDIVNPDDIKTFCILNQMTGKKIVLLAKDIKSSSYRHGVLRVNRYLTVVDNIANYNYRDELLRMERKQKLEEELKKRA